MIVTALNSDRRSIPHLFDQMFRLRAQVFSERLGWDVRVVDGWETDRFDNDETIYVMSVSDEMSTLLGCARLLPTSSPHMMSDIFGAHFEPDSTFRSPLIWEITRFCTSDSARHTLTPSGLNAPTLELLAGVCELGMASGIAQVTAVFEPLMGRIYRRAGLRTATVGKSLTLGKLPVFAGVWDIDQRTLASLRKAGGFAQSVMRPTGSLASADAA
ncbi:MAG: acyl-homoserine-lactone synthase [Bosea sp. (in: a-proteobacteria)]